MLATVASAALLASTTWAQAAGPVKPGPAACDAVGARFDLR